MVLFQSPFKVIPGGKTKTTLGAKAVSAITLWRYFVRKQATYDTYRIRTVLRSEPNVFAHASC